MTTTTTSLPLVTEDKSSDTNVILYATMIPLGVTCLALTGLFVYLKRKNDLLRLSGRGKKTDEFFLEAF
jgi:hypothetical protein